MTKDAPDLREMALGVLQTAGPRAKAAAARRAGEVLRSGVWSLPDPWPATPPPIEPARPDAPQLMAPGRAPRRRLGSIAGRIALMHAVAHIEFNAIDLAFDMAARFAGDARIEPALRRSFVTDWVSVGDDEARHFTLVADRLEALGSHYGALPAHDGLWDAARSTRHDLAARLAIAPLVLEARGLDVTPGMIDRLNSAGDTESAAILSIIYADEIGHVAAGMRWFMQLCENAGLAPAEYFHSLVKQHFNSGLKPPFNLAARQQAQLPATFYEPLAPSGAPLA